MVDSIYYKQIKKKFLGGFMGKWFKKGIICLIVLIWGGATRLGKSFSR
jgi:hypothetical protein